MQKKIFLILAVAFFIFSAAINVTAQQVLMNSAETIKPGNIKLAVFPVMLFGKNSGNSLWGVAGRVGYGLTSNIDIEAKVGLFKGLKYYGVDLEYWFIKGGNFNVSAALGGHITDLKGAGDSIGIDTILLVSTKPVNKLEIYGGLMLAFDSVKNTDINYTLAHLVPGLEYRISNEIDFLAELGIALNDKSRSYVSFGLAWYFLR